ncbi:MAG: serine hydrolase [Candidatus Hydrogenedentota bacterium]
MQRRGIATLAAAAVLVAAYLLTMEPAHTPVVALRQASAAAILDSATPHFQPAQLERELDALISLCPGRPGIVLEAADGSWKITRRGSTSIKAASVIKLPILLAVLRLRARGELDIETRVVVLPADRTEGSGSLKYSPLPHDFTLSMLLERMISESDNTATNAILRIVGLDTIAAEFPGLGLERTRLTNRILESSADNPTTAGEIAGLLSALSRKAGVAAGGRAILPDADALLARALLRSASNAMRLKRYLPDTVSVEHKTGTLRDIVHDAGIVSTPSGDVIVAGLISNVTDRNEAEKWLGLLGKIVYERAGVSE